MLYSQDRHEPLHDIKWNATTVRHEIEEIVRDTESAFQSHNWWPQHPRDDHPLNSPSDKTMYLGAVGVMWALEFLSSKGVASLSRSYENLWSAAWEDYRSVPDTGEEVPSWFLGQSALLLMCMLRGPREQRAIFGEKLFRAVGDNISNPTWEILWGSPGTMLAALFAYEETKDARWSDLYLRCADRLWSEWFYHEELRCHLWTQDLYGRKGIIYGAGHGFAGNAFSLLRGASLLSSSRRDTLNARVATAMKHLAIRSNGLANWPTGRGDDVKPREVATHVQWCHGAPGFLMSTTALPKGYDPELDRLFLEGGELIWQAGRLSKGACFCHGTDGNGMALLSLFKRTGDEMWLDRARLFAMNAIAQSRQNANTFGRRRYTLWTGDLGLAVFLEACLEGRPHMPMLDFV